jgi:hypothetical protein
MVPCLSITYALVIVTANPLETKFVQVAPTARQGTAFERSNGQERALVLIHGLRAHLFSSRNVVKPELHGWQEPDSTLVKLLAKDADLYAFAYGQNVPVERIGAAYSLEENLGRLKKMGYREIILVGHSAGGLIARQFVEDHPDAGITKLVQVATPNGGSSWGKATIGVRENQACFLESLTEEGRRECLARRAGKQVPEGVECVCVVTGMAFRGNVSVSMVLGGSSVALGLGASGSVRGDGVVLCRCQWTEDLQKQGIPAVAFETVHFAAMRTREGAEIVARVVREKQPRWDATEVAKARKAILGN